MDKKTFFKYVEFFLIFVITPLVFVYKLLPSYTVLPILWVLSLYVFLQIKEDTNKILFDIVFKKELIFIFKRFLFFIVLILLFTYLFYEDKLFIFIIEKPTIYILVIFLYPLLSVIPQELIFRKFFVYRYEYIFAPKVLILINSLLFSFMHIIFGNYIAVLFSFIGGVLFINTYLKTKSFSLVCIEHAIYGNFIFTIGLGEYFYHGNI